MKIIVEQLAKDRGLIEMESVDKLKLIEFDDGSFLVSYANKENFNNVKNCYENVKNTTLAELSDYLYYNKKPKEWVLK